MRLVIIFPVFTPFICGRVRLTSPRLISALSVSVHHVDNTASLAALTYLIAWRYLCGCRVAPSLWWNRVKVWQLLGAKWRLHDMRIRRRNRGNGATDGQ